MYEEDTMTWFADDTENFINHYYDELVPENVKLFFDYLEWFDYFFSEDFFVFHYDQVMHEDDLNDIVQEQLWQANFEKRIRQYEHNM